MVDVSDLTNAHYRPVHLCGGALGARIDGRLIIFENIAPRADAKSPVTAARGWVSGCGWMGRSVGRSIGRSVGWFVCQTSRMKTSSPQLTPVLVVMTSISSGKRW